MDSFKRLLEEEDSAPEYVLRNVERRVQNTAKPIRFVGNTADLYLDKVGKTLAAFLGSGSTKSKANYQQRSLPPNSTPPNE